MGATVSVDVVALRDGRFQGVVVVTRTPAGPGAARWTLKARGPENSRDEAWASARAEAERLDTMELLKQI